MYRLFVDTPEGYDNFVSIELEFELVQELYSVLSEDEINYVSFPTEEVGTVVFRGHMIDRSIIKIKKV